MPLLQGPWKGGETRDGGGDGPYDREMEARVAKLEAIIPTLATREDVLRLEAKFHQELHALSWRVIGWTTGIAASLVAATFFVARAVH